jgi:hypothetical protein
VDSINTLLNRLVGDINEASEKQKYHLELVGEDFWTNDESTEKYLQQLTSNFSLIMVDPIALNVVTVLERLNSLRDCFENDKCVISVLPPFAAFPTIQGWRKVVRHIGGNLFKDFVEPGVPPKRVLGNCGICLHDEQDVKRLLRVAVGKSVLRDVPQQKPPYTVVGPGNQGIQL